MFVLPVVFSLTNTYTSVNLLTLTHDFFVFYGMVQFLKWFLAAELFITVDSTRMDLK